MSTWSGLGKEGMVLERQDERASGYFGGIRLVANFESNLENKSLGVRVPRPLKLPKAH